MKVYIAQDEDLEILGVYASYDAAFKGCMRELELGKKALTLAIEDEELAIVEYEVED